MAFDTGRNIYRIRPFFKLQVLPGACPRTCRWLWSLNLRPRQVAYRVPTSFNYVKLEHSLPRLCGGLDGLNGSDSYRISRIGIAEKISVFIPSISRIGGTSCAIRVQNICGYTVGPERESYWFKSNPDHKTFLLERAFYWSICTFSYFHIFTFVLWTLK